MENMVLTTFNLDKICRICLTECESMFSIYSELVEDNSEEKMPHIYEIISSLSSIEVQSGDGLPTMICMKCINKAHSSYKFQQQCNRSQSLLCAYIEQIKDLKVGAINETIAKENIKDKLNVKNEIMEKGGFDMSQENDNLPINDFLPPELNHISQEDLIKNEDFGDSDECDALKNCIPLGEDTVDQLIKDNLQVDNLELISPKIRSFNLDLKLAEGEEAGKVSSGKTNKDISNMNYYRKAGEGSQEYGCNICRKTFRFPNRFRNHLKTHNEEKPYVCTDCNKAFKVYGSLMHHVKSHSGEQPYECKECGKKYKQSGTLTAHLRIHTGSKPFLCSICGRGFRQAPDLTYHMRTHTKEKPYMCNICGRTMSMQCHLVQHMRSHTGEKPFKCSECDKAFPSSTRLKRHSIIHTTLKPYTCNICDKSFNRNSSLRVHTKVHSGVKSHICSVCNKAFLWAHSLRAHVLTHSKTPGEQKNEIVPVPKADSSILEFSTMTIYPDSPAENLINNESFAIYSTDEATAAPESFQIYAVSSAKDEEGVETFTLYSAQSNIDKTSDGTSSLHLSAVGL